MLSLFTMAHVYRGELPQRPTSMEEGRRLASIGMSLINVWNSFRSLIKKERAPSDLAGIRCWDSSLFWASQSRFDNQDHMSKNNL